MDNTRKKPVRLGKFTEKILGPAVMARGFSINRIIGKWGHIAGEASAWSAPVSITFPPSQNAKPTSEDGTLTVNIASGRGVEMQMLTPTIIARCNAVFGYKAISRITITQHS